MRKRPVPDQLGIYIKEKRFVYASRKVQWKSFMCLAVGRLVKGRDDVLNVPELDDREAPATPSMRNVAAGQHFRTGDSEQFLVCNSQEVEFQARRP